MADSRTPNIALVLRQLGIGVPLPGLGGDDGKLNIPILGGGNDDQNPGTASKTTSATNRQTGSPTSSTTSAASKETSATPSKTTGAATSDKATPTSATTPAPETTNKDSAVQPTPPSSTPPAPSSLPVQGDVSKTPEAENQSTVVTNETVTFSTDAANPTNKTDTTGASSKSFLENKVLSGIVFGICGLVALILILTVVWFILRRTRRKKELEEIISWDPEDVAKFHGGERVETSSIDKISLNGSSGSLRNYNGGARDEKNAAPFSSYHPSAGQRAINLSFNTVPQPPPAQLRPGYQQSYAPPGNPNYYGGMA